MQSQSLFTALGAAHSSLNKNCNKITVVDTDNESLIDAFTFHTRCTLRRPSGNDVTDCGHNENCEIESKLLQCDDRKFIANSRYNIGKSYNQQIQFENHTTPVPHISTQMKSHDSIRKANRENLVMKGCLVRRCNSHQQLSKTKDVAVSKLSKSIFAARSHSLSPSYESICICRVGHNRNGEEIFLSSEFEIMAIIGTGFYGVAKKVLHRSSGRILVLKEMLRSSTNYLKTFKRELCLLRKIRHPHVLGFIGINFNVDESISFLVEYMSKGSLHNIIHDNKIKLSWHERIGFARDIALGMKYLHSLNIIHRDLNSHNCLLNADNSVVVADFGLSYVATVEDGEKHCRSRQTFASLSDELLLPERYNVVGSPYWMAPEMLKNQMYDERVDVFSFGIVQCEIIGRIEADPDYLPRTSDFGLNVLLFKQKLCSKDCPKRFLEITVSCCDTDPRNRPSFDRLVPQLRALNFKTS